MLFSHVRSGVNIKKSKKAGNTKTATYLESNAHPKNTPASIHWIHFPFLLAL